MKGLNMKKYMTEYINSIDKILASDDDKIDYNEIRKEHLIKIGFFQHERLIHLLVTLFYVLFVFAFTYISFQNSLFLIVLLILLTFLIFYVLHYFFLENHVQYMYKQDDMLLERINKKRH
jgi:hypothetical protein